MKGQALDLYFDRIAWDGPTSPTLATLTGLLAAHMSAIPFENLDVLLGRPIRLDLDSLLDKLVRNHRGGYCFEQTTLFAAVLEGLGFRPITHSARVVLFSPRDQSPRTHMFLTVPLPEGTFVVDPGFGGPGAIVPIPLVAAAPGVAGHWMAREDSDWVFRAATDGKAIDAWTSTLEQDYAADYEVANHFTATHPHSPFINNLMMSRFTKDGKITLMNRDAAIHRSGRRDQHPIADRAALRTFVAEQFGFDLPEIERLRIPAVPEWD